MCFTGANCKSKLFINEQFSLTNYMYVISGPVAVAAAVQLQQVGLQEPLPLQKVLRHHHNLHQSPPQRKNLQ